MVRMGFSDFVAAVLTANLMTAVFAYGIIQFHRHDSDAPWIAYGAVLMPLLFILASVIVTEGLPPQFDALDSLLSAEQQD